MTRSAPAIVGAALIVQAVLMSITFPVTEVLTDQPLLYIDNAAHWYRITFALNASEHGLTSGYDPFFNAGTVAGSVANPAAKVPAALSILLDGRLSPAVVWKIYVFSLSLLAAVCAPLAMTLLRMDARAVVVGSLWAVLLWWVSVFSWYHTAGLASFVFAAYLALPYAAIVFRYLRGLDGWPALVGLSVLGAFGMFTHPLFPLPVALWTVLCLGLYWREIDWPRAALLLIVVPGLSLLPNLFWLHEWFIAEPLTQRPDPMPHQAFVSFDMIWQELLGVWKGYAQGSKTYPMLMLAALSGLVLTRYAAERRMMLSFVLAGWVWIVYSSFAADIDALALLTQPNRFAPVGYLFLVVPAAAGFVAALDALRDTVALRWWRGAAAALLAALVLLTVINLNELRREVSSADIGHYGSVPPRVSDVGPYTTFALEWLTTQTEPSARVLFETSRARIHDGGHVAGYLAYMAQREFIGGHYIDSYFADFTNGEVFGRRPISGLSHDEFFAYVELYNIGWIMAFSEQSKTYLGSLPSVKRSASHGDLVAYTIDRPHSYFIAGSGKVVSRDHNELIVDDVAGETVILKYHFMRGLEAEPAAKLAPVYLADDPNPFIELTNPPPRLVLSIR